MVAGTLLRVGAAVGKPQCPGVAPAPAQPGWESIFISSDWERVEAGKIYRLHLGLYRDASVKSGRD